MDQKIFLLNSDAKKFVSTVFYATPFPAIGSRVGHREGMFTYLAALVVRAAI